MVRVASALELTLHITLTADEQRALAHVDGRDLPTRRYAEAYLRGAMRLALAGLVHDANALQRTGDGSL